MRGRDCGMSLAADNVVRAYRGLSKQQLLLLARASLRALPQCVVRDDAHSAAYHATYVGLVEDIYPGEVLFEC